jgi:hypothetical protein
MDNNTAKKLAFFWLGMSIFVLYNVLTHKGDPESTLEENGILDMCFFWNKERVVTLFTTIGTPGINEYKTVYNVFDNPFNDVVFATCYGLTLFFALYVLQPKRRWLCLVALLAGAADLGENYCIY